MASKWRDLGTCLGVKSGKLESLAHDVSMSDTTRLIELFSEWDNSRCSHHTFENLINCLKTIDRNKYIHIDKGATLGLLQCLRVIFGCTAIQTNSVETPLACTAAYVAIVTI